MNLRVYKITLGAPGGNTSLSLNVLAHDISDACSMARDAVCHDGSGREVVGAELITDIDLTKMQLLADDGVSSQDYYTRAE